MIEFQPERFSIVIKPRHNKKERRNLGLPKDREVMIEVAKGIIIRKGTPIWIVQTAAITSKTFDKITGYLYFSTSNGKKYKVRYRPTSENENGIN